MIGIRRKGRDRRIEYLAKNFATLRLDGYPWGREKSNPERRDFEKKIIEHMRKIGLISKTTYWKDINLGNLIEEARQFKVTES